MRPAAPAPTGRFMMRFETLASTRSGNERDHRAVGVSARRVAERRNQPALERVGRLRRRQHPFDARQRRRSLARYRHQAGGDLGAAVVRRRAVRQLPRKRAGALLRLRLQRAAAVPPRDDRQRRRGGGGSLSTPAPRSSSGYPRQAAAHLRDAPTITGLSALACFGARAAAARSDPHQPARRRQDRRHEMAGSRDAVAGASSHKPTPIPCRGGDGRAGPVVRALREHVEQRAALFTGRGQAGALVQIEHFVPIGRRAFSSRGSVA